MGLARISRAIGQADVEQASTARITIFYIEGPMHRNAIEKVARQVEGSLKQCRIEENWPKYESFEKHVDPLAEELMKHKGTWLTSADVYSIFYDLVYEAVSDVNNSGSEKLNGQLWDLLGADRGVRLKKDMLEFFESIPRAYEIYIPFNANVSELSDIELNEHLAIVVFEKASDVPGGYRRGLLAMFDENKLQPKQAYFRYRANGYCSRSLQNRTVRQVLTNFKITFQQGIAKKLFVVSASEPVGIGFSGLHSRPERTRLTSVDVTSGRKRIVGLELARDVSSLLQRLTLNPSGEQSGNAVLQQGVNVIKGYLRLPALLMEAKAPEAERVRSAIEWCFDSYATENETMAFLQVCFGLESLFGDETGNEALTSTLADRCAYVVGSDIKGRRSIRAQFRELYEIRSKLVHGSANWLTPNQQHVFRWGKAVLEFAIFKEIRHLGLTD